MPPAVKKTRRPKASNYTYTGCWTCRRRHIKCDEGKPNCNRCTKAGFECQGYDFRFAGSDSSRTFRRPVSQSSAASRAPALSAAKVNEYLDYLDTAAKTTYKGPFSVLAFDAEDTANDSTAHALLEAANDDAQSIASASQHRSQNGLITPPAEATDLAVVDSPHGHLNPMPRELRPMSISPKQGELFEYWSRSLCLHLSPLSDSSTNPFRYLYPSLALEGLTVDPGMGGARLAVFHGICGTAAWSLSKLKPDDHLYRTLSVNHDQLALQYIQQTIERPGGIRDSAIPAAIMACLTGDIVSGRLNSWGRHLRGGFRCMLNVLAQQKASDSTTSSLCQQYLLGAAFGNFGTPSEVRLLQGGILNEALYIEECHGITQSLLIAITATNHLAASGKRQNAAVVDGVRAQLLRSYPRMIDRFRQHLAKVYWYAAMIHFTRAVLRSDETGDLVDMAIDSLERAQEAGKGNPGRILMWPLLKIGPECKTKDLRVRLSAWCESQLGVRNIKTFLENLSSTWALSELPIASDTESMFQAQMGHG